MKVQSVIEPVFILAGQSNMAGRCDPSELPVNLKSPSAYGIDFQMCWDVDQNFGEGCSSNGAFLPLQPQRSPGLDMDIFGPEMALAHSIAPRLGKLGVKRVSFIKFALGSTDLYSNWNPSNSAISGKMSDIGYYPRFLTFCRESLRLLTHDDDISRPLLGMFWLQGESDSSKAKTANAYLSNFKVFTQAVRHDLEHPELPVVVSPVIWKGKKVQVVNEALRQAGDSEVSNCICIEAIDKEVFGTQGEDAGVCAGHLTSAGLCEIGRRMGEAIPLDLYN